MGKKWNIKSQCGLSYVFDGVYEEDKEGEVVDTMAMLFRVLIEGDQVIGLPSTYVQKEQG